MKNALISVLYVDDEPSLLTIGKIYLERSRKFKVTTVASATEALSLLSRDWFDIVVSDYEMPEMDGIEFLKVLRGQKNNIPFIIFTGRGREEVVIEALNEGADFYLQKGGDPASQFTELIHKIQQAVEKKREERARRETEHLLASIIHFLTDATFSIDREGKVVTWNSAMEDMTGIRAEEIIDRGDFCYAVPFYGIHRPMLIDLVLNPDQGFLNHHYVVMQNEKDHIAAEVPFSRINGKELVLWAKASLLFNERGAVIGAIESIRDITDRKRAESALRESQERFRLLVQHSSDILSILTIDGTFRYISPAVERITGFRPDELSGPLWEVIHPEDWPHVQDVLSDIIANPEVNRRTRARYLRKHGGFVTCETTWQSLLQDPMIHGIIAISRDVSEQIEIDTQLREQEARYRLLFQNASDILSVLNMNGKVRYISPAATRIMGFSEEQLKRPLQDLIHPEDWSNVQGYLRDVIATPGGHRRFQARHLCADGHYVTFETIWKSLLDDPDLRGIVAISREVPDQSQTGDAPREGEEYYRTVLYNLPHIAVRLFDSSGRVEFWNAAAEEIFGISEREALGRPMKEIHRGPDMIWDINEDFAQISKTGCLPGPMAWEMQSRDGTVKNTLSTIFPLDAQGMSPRCGCIDVDITAHRQMEDALKESEEFNLMLLENLPDYIAVYDEEGHVQFINAACRQGLGISPEEAKEMDIISYVVPAQQEDVKEELRQRLAGIGHPPYEVQFRSKEGTIMTLLLRAVPIMQSGRRVIMVLLTDITERTQFEEQLRQYSSDLERTSQALALANQKLSLMTKVTRHDITNQLTVMEGYLTLAKDEKDLISISDFLDHASIASRRIAAMIEFTRDYQEIGVKAPIWKNLKTLVETAVKDVPQWKITVVLDIPCNIEVFADPLIVKVFYNLIENAVRYGKGATTLRFALEERTREVILSCEDDGTGIPPEEKDKIFERGYGKGTGLGLFLAREILSITWMTIKETGEYRKGARFEITVPTGVWRQEKVR